jgi:hypothetical protein
MAEKRIIVHVGAHKTGSTSIQQFMYVNRDRLKSHGIAYYRGKFNPANHMELHGAAMRVDRISPFKANRKVHGGPEYASEVKLDLAGFASMAAAPTLVFSAEGLSYLRYPDEMEALKRILPPGGVEIVYYFRNPSDFLAAYKQQSVNWRGKGVNVDDEAWLTDFKARIAAFRETFPKVVAKSYDREMEEVGNVIPSFLDILGVRDKFPPSDWQEIFLNRTSKQ